MYKYIKKKMFDLNYITKQQTMLYLKKKINIFSVQKIKISHVIIFNEERKVNSHY